MNTMNNVSEFIGEFNKRGIDESAVSMTETSMTELNFEQGEFSLLRSNTEKKITFDVINESKKGGSSTTMSNDTNLIEEMEKSINNAKSSVADDAYGINRESFKEKGSYGPMTPDLEKMGERLEEVLDLGKSKFPDLGLREGYVKHVLNESHYMNNHGGEGIYKKGNYQFSVMFSSKRDGVSSSFNYIDGSALNLKESFINQLKLEEIFRNSQNEIGGKKVDEKFEGEMIIHPSRIGSFMEFLIMNLAGTKLFNKSSLFKDSIGKKITSDLISLTSDPRSEELASRSFLTSEGFKTRELDLIKNGVLNNYCINNYYAKKMNMPATHNNGSALFFGAGNKSISELISSVKKGILLGRISAGRPGANGDFSGVAKNSFLIENGEIKNSLSEVMVSGNVREVFENISGVSKERINFGYQINPWLKTEGMTIS